MTTTESAYTPRQPVIVDAYDGPLAGEYVGTRETTYAFAENRVNLRIRVSETAQGYTKGEIIDALPMRVTPRYVVTFDPRPVTGPGALNGLRRMSKDEALALVKTARRIPKTGRVIDALTFETIDAPATRVEA